MHACNVAFSETFVLRSKPHWLHSELLKHWLHSPKDALSTFFTAPHTFPELYCETWLLRQGSVPRVCGIVKKLKRHLWYFSNLASVQCFFWFSGGGGDNKGGRSWQPFGESKKCLQFFRQACICKYMGTLFYIFLKKSLKVLISS